jgi:hypothetical protein
VREVREAFIVKGIRKGGAMARITLDLPDELLSELEKQADKSGVSVEDLIRRTLEYDFPRISGRSKGDISDRPEVRRAIQVQDETRRRLEGSGYSGSETVRRMRDI